MLKRSLGSFGQVLSFMATKTKAYEYSGYESIVNPCTDNLDSTGAAVDRYVPVAILNCDAFMKDLFLQKIHMVISLRALGRWTVDHSEKIFPEAIDSSSFRKGFPEAKKIKERKSKGLTREPLGMGRVSTLKWAAGA